MGLITPSGGLIFWMVLIFAIVFFILAKFGFPVITKMVGKRSDFIAKSLQDAKTAEEKLAGVYKEYDDMMAEAHNQQTKMLYEAREAAQKIVSGAKVQAGVEIEAMKESAMKDIEAMKAQAMQEAGDEIVKLAISISEKIMQRTLTDTENQKRMIDQVVKDCDLKLFQNGGKAS